jgi:hypothetical protein
MTRIVPTIGRMILFHPPANSTKDGFEPNAICAATIAKVLPDGRLNLGVLDGNGVNHSMTEVPLIQEEETPPQDGYYAEWMPYQKSVAKGETGPVLHAQPKSAEDLPLSAASKPVTTT